MANASILRLLIPATLLAAAVFLRAADAGVSPEWIPLDNRAACRGSIAECMGGEFEMDSESNRRMLATTDYISYGALQADRTTCSEPGASYYNCQSGGGANPYTRSCTAATQCRS
ncbi:rapid alkalinization factor-like [Salvia divinorum]|uniref:Rapid alkalinization factor-like n=1 Tax=Salvia divinorum TaxID=28513 RepID=A0ABD1H1G0_SALDI